MLETLRPHPRILLPESRVVEFKRLAASDPIAARMLRDTIAKADAQLKEPVVGRHVLYIAYTCGIAWRMTGDQRYFEHLRAGALAACAEPMPARGDGIGGADMAFGMGTAYDWLRDHVSAEERERIRSYVVERVIKGWAIPSYDEMDWWTDSWININLEANAGMVTAALAVADSEPALAMAILPRALRWMKIALDQYEPDGAWPEGAGYWARTTINTIYGMAGLESALGTDFGLSDRPRSFGNTPSFYQAAVGSTGILATYYDCGERRPRVAHPALLWMARRFRRPDYARFEIDRIATMGAHPLDTLWYEPGLAEQAKPVALDQYFRGWTDFVSLRSGWDRDAAWMYTKGGWSQINHGHADLGSFEFEALGERWARDLGSEDYSLPGHFDCVPGGKRWSYYRLSSLSHNVPSLDGQPQRTWATSRITTFVSDPSTPRVVLEFNEAYEPTAATSRRGYQLVERRALLVQDEMVIAKPCRFAWGMTTDAEIALDGARATLTQNGKRLRATVLAPAGAVFSQQSAEQKPPEKLNTGVKRLVVETPAEKGIFRLAILLEPEWPDGKQVATPALEPLGRWGSLWGPGSRL